MTVRFLLVIVDLPVVLVVVVLVGAHCDHTNWHPNYDAFSYIDDFNRFYQGSVEYDILDMKEMVYRLAVVNFNIQ